MKRSGFTLVEFIVYIAVLAVLGGSVSAMFLWTVQAHAKSRVLQEAVSGSSLAMDTVLREIREAERIYLPTSTEAQVSLKTKTFMLPGETSGFIDFFLCEERLCMKKEGQLPVALTPGSVEVSSLEFVFISTDMDFPSVRMTMEVSYKNPNNRPELTASVALSATASPR
ncbi:MAG: type II secretion system protein [bacterium]|nr:type II secretion system protein [bacterium]